MTIDNEVTYASKEEREAAEAFNQRQTAERGISQPVLIGSDPAVDDDSKKGSNDAGLAGQAHFNDGSRVLAEQKRSIEATERVIDYYDGIQGKEAASCDRAKYLIEKSNLTELTQDELTLLQSWLVDHQEYGLGEMSDQEYFSFFKDGQIYAHTTSLFGTKDYTGKDRPRLIEGIKDCYLISPVVNDERGDLTFRNMAPQRYVTFDGPNLIANHLYDGPLSHDGSSSDSNLHFGYVAYSADPDEHAPVVLLAPARLLENHNTNIAEEHRLNQGLGLESRIETRPNPFTGYPFMDGVPFGSTSPDPNSPSHEIDLRMFTAVMPDIPAKPELVANILQNLTTDPRVTDKMKTELSSYSEAPANLKDLVMFITGILKRNGFGVPRFFFFKPVGKFTDISGYKTLERAEWVMRNGVQDFVEVNQIPIKDSETKAFMHESSYGESASDSIMPQAIERSKIPELFKYPAWEVEELANQVRKILKLHARQLQSA
jgi:hypothetical protein